jgi:hypothetical protein
MFVRRTLAVLGMAIISTLPAVADQWEVVKLRGTVQALNAGIWNDLKRGDMVQDDQSVRTLSDGRADLQRDQEVISLGADTQVKIHDRTGVRYTTVTQDSGSIEVDAQVENVQHFEVDTQFLAAVVKGTHFTVTAESTGASVSVARGSVAVEATQSHQSTTLAVGQTASVRADSAIQLSGTGTLPQVLGQDGLPVAALDAPNLRASFSVGDSTLLADPALRSGATPGSADGGGVGNSPASGAGNAGASWAGIGSSGGGAPAMAAADGKVTGLSVTLVKPAAGPFDFSNWTSGEFGLLMGGLGIAFGAVFGGIGFVFKRFFG